jgi:hypothetical protein
MRPLGFALALIAGAVWGVAFWSWGLPLPIPVRIATTVLLVAALAAASGAGMLAAGAYALGMGVSSGLLLALYGQLFVDWWGLVPASALAAGVTLIGWSLARLSPER